MSTQSVKLELLEWLASVSDDRILSKLQMFKDSVSSGDWWDELTEQQKESIKLGFKDIEEGNVISNTDFWKKYDRYL